MSNIRIPHTIQGKLHLSVQKSMDFNGVIQLTGGIRSFYKMANQYHSINNLIYKEYSINKKISWHCLVQ